MAKGMAELPAGTAHSAPKDSVTEAYGSDNEGHHSDDD
jgi:hypothetical protein